MNKKRFEDLCGMTQKKLKTELHRELMKIYDEVYYGDGYLYAQGTVPILLVAHMDTVHKNTPVLFVYDNDGDKISSPQGIGGDDRCGIYAVMEIVKRYNCSVLFAEDEESGCIGAGKFVKTELAKELEFNYIIELDRKGNKDAVFYECDNHEFEEFITESGDWETDWGSFTDICTLAPAFGCAAVNLSCGYYGAHTLSEYVILSELDECIEKTCRLIEKTTSEDKFEYIEAQYTSKYGSYYGGSSKYYAYGDFSDEEFEYGLYEIR